MNRRIGVAFTLVALCACSDNEPVRSGESTVASLPPLFIEQAAASGLQFTHFAGTKGDYYFPEINGAGVALFDYDGDGDLDVYLVQGTYLDETGAAGSYLVPPPAEPGNRLFRNGLIPEGELRFSDVTDEAGVGDSGYGMGVATGDIDNDGDVDLYVTNVGPNVMYRNDGDGTFTDITPVSGTGAAEWSSSASFLDFDRDGDLDMYVTSYIDYSLASHKPCTNSFDATDYCSPNNYEPVSDRLYRNNGDSAFDDVSEASGIAAASGTGLGVVASDFNADGWPDIYVANDQRPNLLWINNGDGTFRDTGLASGSAYNMNGMPEASMGVTAGDFDGDGDDDLFMTHLDGETNTLYVNKGAGQFADETDRFKLGSSSKAHTGFGSRWFDFDNDGDLDLFSANGAVFVQADQRGVSDFPYGERNQLFENIDGKRFADISDKAGDAFDLTEVSRGAAFGDIDNDGDIDMVVTNNNGPARLLANEIGHKSAWIRLRLIGTTSPRDATGARVALIRGDGALVWRRVHTDGSYLSASDSRILFGLGDKKTTASVGVIWQSGQREMWRDLRANENSQLVEGSGTPWP